MSSSANQPVWVGTSARRTSRAHPHEAEPRRPEQVLHGATRDDVGAERCDVQLDRTARLVAVGQHDRPCLVGRLGDRGDVVAMARAVGERRAADERRPLVDRRGEALGRDRAVVVRLHVDDLRAAQLLGVGDLPDRGELVLADHDPVPLAVESERGDQPADSLRDRRRNGHVVGLGVDERGDRRAEGLVPLDPEVPLGSVLVPAGEPPLDGVSNAVG